MSDIGIPRGVYKTKSSKSEDRGNWKLETGIGGLARGSRFDVVTASSTGRSSKFVLSGLACFGFCSLRLDYILKLRLINSSDF